MFVAGGDGGGKGVGGWMNKLRFWREDELMDYSTGEKGESLSLLFRCLRQLCEKSRNSKVLLDSTSRTK